MNKPEYTTKVLPIRFSKTFGSYCNYWGETSYGAVKDNEYYEHYLIEERPGYFTLGTLRGIVEPNAKKIKITCPWHCNVLLQPVDKNTLVCLDCNPYHKKYLGGK